MRVVLLYAHLRAGGCERRMGDICSWLLRNGDEAWIAGATCDDLGMTMLTRQCGVPAKRIVLMEPGAEFDHFAGQVCYRLDADLVDVQWAIQVPIGGFPCAAIATMHGAVGPPPAQLFHGVISVEDEPGLGHQLSHAGIRHFRTVLNWVHLERFPFREELGRGVCFVGRSFKMANVHKLARHHRGPIDCYGTITAGEHIAELPENAIWRGFEDSAEVFPRYRVVLASAQTAMEALAAGRFVLAGQTLHYVTNRLVPDGRIVRPELVGEMTTNGCSYSYKDPPEPSAEEIASAVVAALREDRTEERRDLRGWVERTHSLEAQVRKIRAFYGEVAG